MKNSEAKQHDSIQTELMTVRIEFFSAITDKPDEFVDALERLCRKYCKPDGFFFRYALEG